MHLAVGSSVGDGEVIGKVFSGGRGDMMAAKDSGDEGGRSAIRPLDGLSELEPW